MCMSVCACVLVQSLHKRWVLYVCAACVRERFFSHGSSSVRRKYSSQDMKKKEKKNWQLFITCLQTADQAETHIWHRWQGQWAQRPETRQTSRDDYKRMRGQETKRKDVQEVEHKEFLHCCYRAEWSLLEEKWHKNKVKKKKKPSPFSANSKKFIIIFF